MALACLFLLGDNVSCFRSKHSVNIFSSILGIPKCQEKLGEKKKFISSWFGFLSFKLFCFVKIYCVYQVQGDTHDAHGAHDVHDAHEAYDTRVFLFVFIKFCLIPFALVTFQGELVLLP